MSPTDEQVEAAYTVLRGAQSFLGKDVIRAMLTAALARPAEGDEITHADLNTPCDAALRQRTSRPAQAEDGWKPIETAPKDGAQVDLWCRAPGLSSGPTRVPECWHSGGHWWRYDAQYGDDQCRSRVHNATHWRPLPEPPRDALDRDIK